MSGQESSGDLPAIVALWSAPRSRSTAFARMMAERGDYIVLHEPFSYIQIFGESCVGDQLVRSEEELIAALRSLAQDGPCFFKDTTDYHYPVLLDDEAFLATAVHTFLIRHPAEAIASYYALHPGLQRDEVGFARLAEIYDAVAGATGQQPVIVDSADLVARPHETVAAYCRAIGIPVKPEALSWEPRMETSWRRTARWHDVASRTAGFVRDDTSGAGKPRWDELKDNPVLAGYLDYHLPFYERLLGAALKV
jgi:hypothetical protein